MVREGLKDFVSGMVRKVEATVNRLVQNTEIGMRRVYRLQHDYEKAGYYVIVNSNVNAGVDLIAFSVVDGRPLVEVVESTNYSSPKWYMKDDRFGGYVSHLNCYDDMPSMYIVKKKIVVSYLQNLRPRAKMSEEELQARLKECEKNNIDVVEVGYQD